MAVQEEQPVMGVLEHLANKHQSVHKAISVLQLLLRMQPAFRQLAVPAQRELCRQKFLTQEYDKVAQQLKQRSTKLTQQLLLNEDKDKKIFKLRGRFGYTADLLPSPKTSPFSRLVLRDAHSKQHLTNAARIMAKLGEVCVHRGGSSVPGPATTRVSHVPPLET